MKKLNALFLCFLPLLSLAQEQTFQDCTDPFFVCDFSPKTFDFQEGSGAIFDDLLSGSCFPESFEELNATWIQFKAATAGQIWFTIVPDPDSSLVQRDIDFIVYRLNNGDCTDRSIERCMASGENVGPPIDTTCLGPTGLVVGETDLSENPGCMGMSNNFLAPLDVLPGEEYTLYISSFFEGVGFEITFGGTADLDCATVNTTLVPDLGELKLLPNPVKEDWVRLEIPKHIGNDDLQLQIFDMSGIRHKTFNQAEFHQAGAVIELPIGDLRPQLYFIRLSNHTQHYWAKLVRL